MAIHFEEEVYRFKVTRKKFVHLLSGKIESLSKDRSVSKRDLVCRIGKTNNKRGKKKYVARENLNANSCKPR